MVGLVPVVALAERAGDRQVNSALHRIAIVRKRHHQPARDYVARQFYRLIHSTLTEANTSPSMRDTPP